MKEIADKFNKKTPRLFLWCFSIISVIYSCYIAFLTLPAELGN